MKSVGDRIRDKNRKQAGKDKPEANGEATGGQPRVEDRASVGSVGRASVPRQLPPYRPFPLELLPPTLREYTEAAASAIGCDPALVALPSLAVAASCTGNARAIRLKRGWEEPSVVWAVTIAPSGKFKSPAWGAAVDPLMALQMDLADAHEQAAAAWEAKPDEEKEGGEAPKGPTRYVTSDATIEAVGELLADNPRGLLLARDELDGWFQAFTRYKGKAGGTDRPNWLELHRAGTLTLDRLTRKRKALLARRACCSVCGTIQPGVLARSLDEEAMAAGLGARFLLNMPPIRKRRWSEAEVDEGLSRRYSGLLAALLALSMADAGKRRPHVLTMSDGAKRVWVDWFDHWGNAMDAAEGEQSAALAKLEGYAARLALLHHVVSCAAAEDDDLREVGDRSVRVGIALAEWFAGEAARVYATLKESAAQREQRRLVEWIASRGGRAGVRELQHANSRRWPTRDHAEADLDALVKAGLGAWEEAPPPPTGGHPQRWVRLHVPPSDTSDSISLGNTLLFKAVRLHVPPSDTSDTRPNAEAPAAPYPPDGRADTRERDSENQAKNDRVSEVSDGQAGNGEVSPPPVTGGGEGRVSGGAGGWTAPGAENLVTPWG
jgi:hypothetical protein